MTATSSPIATVGKPRSLTSVILRSVASGLLYYGYYKWMIQDELKAYAEQQSDKGLNASSGASSGASSDVWSGALCIIPFVLGIAIPLALAKFDPDVPSWFGWLAFSGVLWIYIVQFRLYREVNRLYVAEGLKPPLICWWIVVPGLNLIVGLRQIHFLSEYWARRRDESVPDPIAKFLPFLSDNS